ncbi:MAG TPA: histidine--tRNA ligase [Pirellulaceae bacterium]|nr:histidine--tRNA ligase [Pirellulaceae bacterium]
MIEPRTLKGFRDFLPAAMMRRERLMEAARRVYRSFGFAPIETPVLEYLEILTGKGSEETDRQMYRFQDAGGRWVGMRFDLTVPLARFCAQHHAELGTPFKRYHIAPVWRGENTHRGRYREFMQCDFDTIGTRSIVADIEVAAVIDSLLREIGIERFSIRINHRQVLNGLLDRLGLRDRATTVLRALDKLGKIDADAVVAEIVGHGAADEGQARRILEMVSVSGTNDEILEQLERLADGHEGTLAGVGQLRQVLDGAVASGVPAERLRLDPTIARGLDYYTGTIYETFLDDLPDIGSVCSGGRYDNLAGLYTKQELPGIGASLGLDRLLAALEELGSAETARSPARILLVQFDASRLADYLRMATEIRRGGLAVELFPEPKKLGQQLKYADRQGFRLAVIAGSQEFEASMVKVKNLKTGETIDVPTSDGGAALVTALRDALAAGD